MNGSFKENVMIIVVINGRTWFVVNGVAYKTRQAALEAIAGSK